MKISSPAFADKGFIPIEYTQEGEDLSPPLVISDIPEAAKSLVLIVEDPDAPDPENPKLIFTHWIVYNLPPQSMELAAGQERQRHSRLYRPSSSNRHTSVFL